MLSSKIETNNILQLLSHQFAVIILYCKELLRTQNVCILRNVDSYFEIHISRRVVTVTGTRSYCFLNEMFNKKKFIM